MPRKNPAMVTPPTGFHPDSVVAALKRMPFVVFPLAIQGTSLPVHNLVGFECRSLAVCVTVAGSELYERHNLTETPCPAVLRLGS